MHDFSQQAVDSLPKRPLVDEDMIQQMATAPAHAQMNGNGLHHIDGHHVNDEVACRPLLSHHSH